MSTYERELALLPERPGLCVIQPRQCWTAELGDLTLRDGLVVWDDTDEPDEPIRLVYILPCHGGIVEIVTDQNLYVLDAAAFEIAVARGTDQG